MFLRNVCIYLRVYKATKLTRTSLSSENYLPIWKCMKISYDYSNILCALKNRSNPHLYYAFYRRSVHAHFCSTTVRPLNTLSFRYNIIPSNTRSQNSDDFPCLIPDVNRKPPAYGTQPENQPQGLLFHASKSTLHLTRLMWPFTIFSVVYEALVHIQETLISGRGICMELCYPTSL